MKKRTTKNIQSEQKMNSELKADNKHVSHDIANALVACRVSSEESVHYNVIVNKSDFVNFKKIYFLSSSTTFFKPSSIIFQFFCDSSFAFSVLFLSWDKETVVC